ncbi:MAG: O-antigen ligase family protein [Candidatus Omnitrophica bacterium]|nr:O-antigen ligase family protein [Candidatus Omnitrophota bacterium]
MNENRYSPEQPVIGERGVERPLLELPTLGMLALAALSVCVGLSLLFLPWYIAVSIFIGGALCLVIFFNLFTAIIVVLVGAFFHPSYWLPQLAVIRPAMTLSILVLFVWLIHTVIYQDFKIVKIPQNYFLLGYFAVALLTSFKLPDASLPFFFELAPKAIIIYFAILHIVKTRRQMIILTWALGVITVLLSLVGLYQYVHGIGYQEGAMLRLKGLSYDPNYFAFELIVPLPVILSLFFYYRHIGIKVVLALFALCISGGIALTYSRAGFVMLICVLLFTVGGRIRKRSNIVVSGLLIALFFAALACFIPAAYWDRIQSILNLDDPAINERIVAAQTGIEMILKNPLTGVGWGLSHWEFFKTSLTSGTLPHKLLNAHNTFILTAAEMGVAGLAFFLLLFKASFRCLKEAQKRFRAGNDLLLADIAAGFYVSLIIYLVGGMFISYNQLLQFWLIVPISAVLHQLAKQDSGK